MMQIAARVIWNFANRSTASFAFDIRGQISSGQKQLRRFIHDSGHADVGSTDADTSGTNADTSATDIREVRVKHAPS